MQVIDFYMVIGWPYFCSVNAAGVNAAIEQYLITKTRSNYVKTTLAGHGIMLRQQRSNRR
tara:strand:+ start:627 stop:806 length:180 start_codon:yes stop_codon:yes gene_type:complete